MTKTKKMRIERIGRYEAMLDRCLEAVGRCEALGEAGGSPAHVKNELAGVAADARALGRYYGSAVWRRDLDADERGELPADLRRGVLSEDGVYNVLERLSELARTFEEQP